MSTQVARYLMNPAEDVIRFGDELAEGMLVLPEDYSGRATEGPEEVQLRGQRFCRVTRLRMINDPARFGGRPGVMFVGEWVDGYQEVMRARIEFAWIVKKDSLPVPGAEDSKEG